MDGKNNIFTVYTLDFRYFLFTSMTIWHKKNDNKERVQKLKIGSERGREDKEEKIYNLEA